MDAQRSDQFDPYAVLQVAPEADDAVIAAAYRALARRFHPDVAGEGGTTRMRAINAAWEVLRTPERRAAFDRQRAAADPRPTTSTAAPRQHSRAPIRQHPPARRGGWIPDPGTGAAGPPPGRPSGSVLTFGRHLGWSLGEIARTDPGYLEWLDEKPEGAPYREEIAEILRRLGRRSPAPPSSRRDPWRRT